MTTDNSSPQTDSASNDQPEQDIPPSWELVGLRDRLRLLTDSAEEAVPRKRLCKSVAHAEHLDENVADMIIEKAVTDGLLEPVNDEKVRLREAAMSEENTRE